ncbi:unnamed protein product [Closterium sp. Naga37s-1]|nr:unnamed protein product [Closterium sp. Naga37s-1]
MAVGGETNSIAEAVKGLFRLVRGELAALKGELAVVREEVGRQNERVLMLEERNQVLENEVNALRRALGAVGERSEVTAAVVEKRERAEKEELIGVQEDLTAMKGEVNAVKGEVNAVKGGLSAVNRDLAEHKNVVTRRSSCMLLHHPPTLSIAFSLRRPMGARVLGLGDGGICCHLHSNRISKKSMPIPSSPTFASPALLQLILAVALPRWHGEEGGETGEGSPPPFSFLPSTPIRPPHPPYLFISYPFYHSLPAISPTSSSARAAAAAVVARAAQNGQGGDGGFERGEHENFAHALLEEQLPNPHPRFTVVAASAEVVSVATPSHCHQLYSFSFLSSPSPFQPSAAHSCNTIVPCPSLHLISHSFI